MRCRAPRCTADPGPPRTGTVHASRVYPTCAHWVPISGKPEIGVCRKTGKYRDRTNQCGARVFGSLNPEGREAPSRRMRTGRWVAPSCFETHRSALPRWQRLRSRCAAMLLSMRAGERCAFWPNEPNGDFGQTKPPVLVVPAEAGTQDHWPVFISPGSRCAQPGDDNHVRSREGPTCGCTKRALAHLPCFQPVLYREPCNLNVSRRGHPHSLLTRCDRIDGRSWRSRRGAGRSRCCRLKHSGRRRCCRCRAPPTTSTAARCCCRFARS
jgi:hypothetical protein